MSEQGKTAKATDPTGATPDQLYTFDDVELYTYCHMRGRPGWILDKGQHLVSASDGSHIHIQFEDSLGGRGHLNVHEKAVNKFLREKRTLWIDFGHRLAPTGSNNATDN